MNKARAATGCTLLLVLVSCGGSRRAHSRLTLPEGGIHIDEPSGLTATNLTGRSGAPLALAIDDDEQDIFLIAPLPSGLSICERLELPTTVPVVDLEAICFDGREGETWYYAFPSHRLEDETGSLGTVRFKLESSDGGHAVPASSVGIMYLGENIIRALDASEWIQVSSEDKGRRIEGRPWWKSRKRETPYALEIEAAVCVQNNLLVGLKVPVAHEEDSPHAVLLEYSLEQDLEQQVPVVRPVSLGTDASYGISALAYDSTARKLFAALNPIGASDEELDEIKGRGFGHSRLVELKRTSLGFVVGEELWEASRSGAKLEGLAVVQVADQRELWLTYDGRESVLIRIDLTDQLTPNER